MDSLSSQHHLIDAVVDPSMEGERSNGMRKGGTACTLRAGKAVPELNYLNFEFGHAGHIGRCGASLV